MTYQVNNGKDENAHQVNKPMTSRRGGAGRGQGRKKNYPGRAGELQVIQVPSEIKDSANRLLQELWKQKLIHESSSAEELISILQMQNLLIFDDVAIPASFSFSENEISNAETLNLVQDVFESRKSSPQNRLIAVRVKGDSMDQSGVFPGDLLIIEFFTDFGNPEDGEIVVAYVDNNPTIKRYMQQPDGKVALLPNSSNPKHLLTYPGPLDSDRCQIIGVVRYVIHDLKSRY